MTTFEQAARRLVAHVKEMHASAASSCPIEDMLSDYEEDDGGVVTCYGCGRQAGGYGGQTTISHADDCPWLAMLAADAEGI